MRPNLDSHPNFREMFRRPTNSRPAPEMKARSLASEIGGRSGPKDGVCCAEMTCDGVGGAKDFRLNHEDAGRAAGDPNDHQLSPPVSVVLWCGRRTRVAW